MNIDFILSSFPPMPDGVWVAASGMIDSSIRLCGRLLGGFVILKMMYDWYESYEEVSVAMHIRTLFRALAIIVFFRHYKQLLMYFDYFIDALCIHEDGGELVFDKFQSLGNNYEPIKGFGFRAIGRYIKRLFELMAQIAVLFTHGGAIYFMHYTRAVALLLLAQVGPIAALLSWLPGPFGGSFQQWMKNYASISCWAITLQVFWVLAQGFGTNIKMVGIGSQLGLVLFHIALFLAILSTPTWTSNFINGNTLGSFTSGLWGRAMGLGSAVARRLPIKRLPLKR